MGGGDGRRRWKEEVDNVRATGFSGRKIEGDVIMIGDSPQIWTWNLGH